jgi:hypothetical protein
MHARFLPMIDIRAKPRPPCLVPGSAHWFESGRLAAASAVSLHKFPKKSIYGKLAADRRASGRSNPGVMLAIED